MNGRRIERDHARRIWVEVDAPHSIVVYPPKATKAPVGFVHPPPDPQPTVDVKSLAGGWAKR